MQTTFCLPDGARAQERRYSDELSHSGMANAICYKNKFNSSVSYYLELVQNKPFVVQTQTQT